MNNTKRIEYIDAMRGFTMLLVVYSHILTFSYNESFNIDLFQKMSLSEVNPMTFNAIFILFRMPLFFFISGFILYKKDTLWNLSNSLSFLRKKAKIQLIPTALFFSLYVYLFNHPYFESATMPLKMGYWFTIALFEYFFIYVLFRFVFDKFNKSSITNDIMLLILSLIVYFASTPTALSKLNFLENPICGLLGLEQLRYFIFFVIGTLIKKHFEKAQQFMDNRFITAFCILSFLILTTYFLHAGYSSNALYNHLYLISTGVLGLLIVFSFFRKYQESFTQEKKLGRILQYIGKRTLDIYLLHYFFVPQNLQVLGEFFSIYVNPIIEFTISIIISTIVIGICLIVSNILRISPLLGHYLFGVKSKT